MKSTPILAVIAAAAVFAAVQSPAVMAQENPETINWQFNGSLLIQVDSDHPIAYVPIKAEFKTQRACKEFPASFSRNAVTATGASTGTESTHLYDYFRDNAKTVLYGACTSK